VYTNRFIGIYKRANNLSQLNRVEFIQVSLQALS